MIIGLHVFWLVASLFLIGLSAALISLPPGEDDDMTCYYGHQNVQLLCIVINGIGAAYHASAIAWYLIV
jgi:hypothetical protein